MVCPSQEREQFCQTSKSLKSPKLDYSFYNRLKILKVQTELCRSREMQVTSIKLDSQMG